MQYIKERNMMNKVLATLASAAVMSAGVAMAATPVAPVMSMAVKTTKVAEGDVYMYNGGRQLAIDGNNVYVAFTEPALQASIIRSIDGGLTWGEAAELNYTDNANGNSIRIALAKDPLYPAKKIVAATYGTTNNNSINYRYYVDRPTGAIWSQPVVIDTGGDPYSISMAAAPNGNVHVLYTDISNSNVYYASATTADSAFTFGPLKYTDPATNLEVTATALYSEIAVATDSANNLYAVVPENESVTLYKKSYGSSTWTAKTVVDSGAANAASVAALDANNIYIAYRMQDPKGSIMWIASTSNGGTSWTKKIVTPHSAQDSSRPSIAVNSSKVISLAATYNPYTPNAVVVINKSSDNGATWSPNTVVAGSHGASLAIDAAGKTAIVSEVYYDLISETDKTFQNGAAAGGYTPIYFTREK
jgi:hypothetical protein